MVELLQQPKVWIAFVALTLMEMVLGIDNIVLISLLADRVPQSKRRLAGRSGLILGMVGRIGLLLALTYLLGFTRPVLTLPFLGADPMTGLSRGALSPKDLLLIAGGLFLLAKSSNDIHDNLEDGGEPHVDGSASAFSSVLLQMFLLNTVFSIDSVLTAIGMVDHVEVMIAAIIVATALMFIYAKFVAQFVRSHPSTKMLALAFIVLISVNLIAEGFHYAIPKGYTYFSMAFAVGVELLNRKARSKRKTIRSPVNVEPQPMH